MRYGLRYAALVLLFMIAMRPQMALARGLLERIDQKLFGRSPELAAAYDAYDAGRYEEALRGFQAYANTHTSVPEHLYNAGVAAYKAGKADEAMRFFEQAVPEARPAIKAEALANEALIDIAKKDLEAARDKLKNALAYDNDNKAIAENLAWVEEQLQHKDPEQQRQKQNQQQSKQDQQTAQQQGQQDRKDQKQQGQSQEQKNAQQDQKQQAAQDQQNKQGAQDQKSAEQKSAQQNQDQRNAQQSQQNQQGAQDQKSGEQKTAEQKSGEEQKAGAGQKSDDKKPKGQEQASYSALDPKQRDDQQRGQPKADGYLTQEDLKQQEAERLLRSVEDKIGRYPLTDTEATGKRGNDDKNW